MKGRIVGAARSHSFTVQGLAATLHCIIMLAGGVALMVTGAERTHAFLAGVPGHVTVDHCHWKTEGKRSGWDCSGPFIAHDGGLRIDRVRIRLLLYDRPTGPVEAKVTGPSATSAWEPDPWSLTPVGAGLILFAVATYGLWFLLRVIRDDDTTAQDGKAGWGPPQRPSR